MVTEFNQGFDELGISVRHHMPGQDGVYMKQVFVPAGVELHNHTHTFTHKSLLASGTARVTSGAETKEVYGPCVLTIERGVPHKVEAVTDIIWFCIHATDEQDADRIDHTLVGKD